MTEIYWYNPWAIAMELNTVLLAIAFVIPKKLLTPAGYIHAWILGVLVWGTLGWRGYIIVMFYFLLGSAVTFVRIAEKEVEGIAQEGSGARGPGNVWGSALAGMICALATLWSNEPLRELSILGYVASFSTKLSDTVASEIGKAFGKHTFLITTLKSVPRGTEGAVSLEGTLAGIVASVAIALLAWGIGAISLLGAMWCAIAALIATTIESWIGATLEPKFTWLTNDLVNFINTAIGALSAMLLASIFS
jgi:uncharacterized protein (TIGR00297 family)